MCSIMFDLKLGVTCKLFLCVCVYAEVNTYVFRFFGEKMVFCEEFEKVNPLR